jgi:MFS family permease
MQSSQSQVYLTDEENNFRVYPQRFWVLFIFVFLTSNQCMFWLTFSPIAGPTMAFYHITEATVDLLLNWGPIIFLPILPLVYLLLNSHHGLRKCVLIFAILPMIATCLRLIPLLVTSPTNSNFHDVSVPCLHIGQILIAIVGPIAMALVSQLSCIWFAPHERTRATTIAILGASFGGAAAFLISPFLVSQSWQVPRLLYMHAGQALVACILTLAYFPAEPPSPPSVAAGMLRTNRLIQRRSIEILKKVLLDIFRCCQNLSCVLLILSGAAIGGTFTAWGGLFATILTPLGHSEIEAGEKLFFKQIKEIYFHFLGWFGFGLTIANIIGSLAMGYIADHRRFQRSFKSLMLISLTLCFIFSLLFQLSVRTVLWPDNPIIPSSSVSIGILISITGFFYGAAFPLFYESLAEIMHPLPESLSTSILVEFFNIVSLIFLAIASNRYKLMNLLVLLMIGISIVMVACTRMKYKRKDEELRKVEEQGYEFNQNTSTA